MMLLAYLQEEKITFAEFARRCGTKHARTIERIAKGTKRAGPKMLPKIISESKGRVTANDLLGIELTAPGGRPRSSTRSEPLAEAL